MIMKRATSMVPAVMAFVACGLEAGVPVEVTLVGEVEFNQITAGALGAVNPGDGATMSFLVDSDVFDGSVAFPTRGYVIDPASFSLTLGTTVVALENPFSAGTPYFVLRDNDPAVDGFFVSTSVDVPLGLPLDEAGVFGPFVDNYAASYQGDTLVSLDILDALGTYDFTGLKSFNWTIDDGPFNPMGLVIEQLILEDATGKAVPTLSQWGLAAMAGLLAATGAAVVGRRRRTVGPGAMP